MGAVAPPRRSLLRRRRMVRTERILRDSPYAVGILMINDEAPSRVNDGLATAHRRIGRCVIVSFKGVIAGNDELADRLFSLRVGSPLVPILPPPPPPLSSDV